VKRIQNISIPIFQYLFVCLFLSNIGLSAQERVKPSKGYMAGDTINAPMFGIKVILPEHWNGFLARGTEVFTMESDTALGTSIIVFPSEEDLSKIEARWKGGVALSPGMDLEPTVPPKIREGKLSSQFKFTGDDNRVGYSFAQCGEFGFCYTALLVVDKSRAPLYRNVVDELSEYVSFYEPTLTEFYGDYDWSEELKGKYMVSFESAGGYSVKQNHLWLCEDGTFVSRIKRKGGFKGTTGKYKGKLKGTYQAEGIGSTGKILLNFEKLSPLEMPLEIKDDVVYMNGLRYSVSSEHNQCR
jgi:hypothetical protein